jgi:hypothetical protein
MIWLGGLLLAVSLLELFRKQRYFAFAALVAGIGFITTLDLINIDSLIVKQNVSRYQEGETLDIAYLASLTVDAVPTLVDLYQHSPAAEKQVLSGAIACHAELNYRYDYADDPDQRYSWLSFHFSRMRAQQVGKDLLDGDPDQFAVYYHGDSRDSWDSYVIINGEEVSCATYGWD